MEQQYAAFQPSSKATTEPVRSFSTNSRPALRAAYGRPPARQQRASHRGTGLTLHTTRYGTVTKGPSKLPISAA